MIKNKRRKPRKVKKRLAKNGVLIYDVATLPRQQTIRDIHKAFSEMGIVLWASKANDNYTGRDCDNAPQVVSNIRKFKSIDVSNA